MDCFFFFLKAYIIQNLDYRDFKKRDERMLFQTKQIEPGRTF